MSGRLSRTMIGAVALSLGLLAAPLTAVAGNYGGNGGYANGGYKNYSGGYVEEEYIVKKRCYYKRVRYYDKKYYEYRYRRVKVCEDVY
jgi:hypothetical protein